MDLSSLDKFASRDVSDTSRTGSTLPGATRGDESFANHLEPRTSEFSTAPAQSGPTNVADGESLRTEDERSRVEEEVPEQDEAEHDENPIPSAPAPSEQQVTSATPAEIADVPPVAAADSEETAATHDAAARHTARHGKAAPAADTVAVPDTHDHQATQANVSETSEQTGSSGPAGAEQETESPLPATPRRLLVQADHPAIAARADDSGKKEKGDSRIPHPAAHRGEHSAQHANPSTAGDAPQTTPGRTEQTMLQLPVVQHVAPSSQANTEPVGTSERVEQVTQPESSPRAIPLTQRLSDHLFGRGYNLTGSGPENPHVDQTRLIQRVARALEAAPRHGGILRLRLSPPELGSLQLEVTISKGVMNAKLEAETHAARTALLDHLPQLRDRLAEQGVRIAQFDVDVSRRDTQDAPHQPHPSFEPNATKGRLASQQEIPAESLENTTKLIASIPGKLNVVV